MSKPEMYKAQIICPKCKTDWCLLHFDFESVVRPSDVIVNEAWRDKVHNPTEFKCPKCEYTLTGMDVYACIAKSSGWSNETITGLKTRGL